VCIQPKPSVTQMVRYMVRYSQHGSQSVYRLLEEVLPLLLSGWGRQGRLAGSYVPNAVTVVTYRKNESRVSREVCLIQSDHQQIPLFLKEAIEKHATDVMQSRCNSLIYACFSALIAAAIKVQRLATAVANVARVLIERHKYGVLP